MMRSSTRRASSRISTGRLAPTYPDDRREDLRINGRIGLRSEIDLAALERDMKNAQEDLGVARSEADIELAQSRLTRLEAMRSTVSN